MSACEATVARTVTGTGTGTVSVSRKSDAPAFRSDVMPKITKPAAAPTSSPTLTRAASTVEIENKCPEAEATAFSYQRAAKRAAPQKQHRLAEIAAQRPETPEAPAFETILGARSTNPCEDITRNLALRKARLKADFFGGPSTASSEKAKNQNKSKTKTKPKPIPGRERSHTSPSSS